MPMSWHKAVYNCERYADPLSERISGTPYTRQILCRRRRAMVAAVWSLVGKARAVLVNVSVKTTMYLFFELVRWEASKTSVVMR